MNYMLYTIVSRTKRFMGFKTLDSRVETAENYLIGTLNKMYECERGKNGEGISDITVGEAFSRIKRDFKKFSLSGVNARQRNCIVYSAAHRLGLDKEGNKIRLLREYLARN